VTSPDGLERRPAVLVIEEDHPLGSLLSTLLERDGFAVQWAADGPDALPRNDAEAFDAYVIDLVLSGRSGVGLIGGIPKEIARRTVVVTGMHDALLAAIRSEVFAILRKPFANEVFVDTVKRCCGGSGPKPARLVPGGPSAPPAVEGGGGSGLTPVQKRGSGFE
jgi:DNA-binding NtrC family response regulator